MKPVATALAILAALIVFHAPASAQAVDASASMVSGNSDCTTQSRVSNDGTFRELIRCVNGGIRSFMLAFLPIDANGNPDGSQDLADNDLQNFIETMNDLGWRVARGAIVDLPAEYNAAVPYYIFSQDTCVAGNCSISGDDPATTAYLTPLFTLTSVWRVVPLTPDYSCLDDGAANPEPCWIYVDCDSVKHYAACVEDAVAQGYSTVYPDCNICPTPVATEPTTWGRLKIRYGTGGAGEKPRSPKKP